MNSLSYKSYPQSAQNINFWVRKIIFSPSEIQKMYTWKDISMSTQLLQSHCPFLYFRIGLGAPQAELRISCTVTWTAACWLCTVFTPNVAQDWQTNLLHAIQGISLGSSVNSYFPTPPQIYWKYIFNQWNCSKKKATLKYFSSDKKIKFLRLMKISLFFISFLAICLPNCFKLIDEKWILLCKNKTSKKSLKESLQSTNPLKVYNPWNGLWKGSPFTAGCCWTPESLSLLSQGSAGETVLWN